MKVPEGWKIHQDNGNMYCPDHAEEFGALLNITADTVEAHSHYLSCQALNCSEFVDYWRSFLFEES